MQEMQESILDELSGPSSIGRREDLGSREPQEGIKSLTGYK